MLAMIIKKAIICNNKVQLGPAYNWSQCMQHFNPTTASLASSLPQSPQLPAPPLHHTERHHTILYVINWKLRTLQLYGKEYAIFSPGSELL